MKKTPLARGNKQMKRSGFAKKPYSELLDQKQAIHRKTKEKSLKVAKRAKKPHKTVTLKKLKAKLWQLCREIQIKRYGSDCYTCPSKSLEGSNRHLGHFISSSICSTELRYSLDNLRIQCYACNIHKSGNWLAYERHLIADGIDVQELKDRNEKTKGGMYREDFYIQKIAEYTSILAGL